MGRIHDKVSLNRFQHRPVQGLNDPAPCTRSVNHSITTRIGESPIELEANDHSGYRGSMRPAVHPNCCTRSSWRGRK
jgi:hypothetical protein